jgi:hypothetical protein
MEEIRKMTDEELGSLLMERLDLSFEEYGYAFLLCLDLNKVAKVERIVIERCGASNYGWELFNVLPKAKGNDLHEDLVHFATATARQRCEALVMVMEEKR